MHNWMDKKSSPIGIASLVSNQSTKIECIRYYFRYTLLCNMIVGGFWSLTQNSIKMEMSRNGG